MTDEDGMFMRIRWFGEPWGSILNTECEQTKVPVNTKCLECNQLIGSRDRGIITACSPNIWGSWWLYSNGYEYRVCSYHLSCWFRVVVGEEITGAVLARMQGATTRKLDGGDPLEDEVLEEEEPVIQPGGWGKT